MKLGILCVTVAYFATLANGKILSDPVKSYENHQVFRIEIASKESHETLSSIHGIHFWNEGRIGGHADVMVAPEEIEQFKQFLSEQGFKYSTMIENVGDLIKLEKVSKIIDVLETPLHSFLATSPLSTTVTSVASKIITFYPEVVA